MQYPGRCALHPGDTTRVEQGQASPESTSSCAHSRPLQLLIRSMASAAAAHDTVVIVEMQGNGVKLQDLDPVSRLLGYNAMLPGLQYRPLQRGASDPSGSSAALIARAGLDSLQ